MRCARAIANFEIPSGTVGGTMDSIYLDCYIRPGDGKKRKTIVFAEERKMDGDFLLSDIKKRVLDFGYGGLQIGIEGLVKRYVERFYPEAGFNDIFVKIIINL